MEDTGANSLPTDLVTAAPIMFPKTWSPAAGQLGLGSGSARKLAAPTELKLSIYHKHMGTRLDWPDEVLLRFCMCNDDIPRLGSSTRELGSSPDMAKSLRIQLQRCAQAAKQLHVGGNHCKFRGMAQE